MLILRRFLRDVPAVIGALIVLTLVIVAIFAPYIAPRLAEAFDSNLMMRLKPPSADYPFGTDGLGRDILSRVILGTRPALAASLIVVLGAMVIGIPLGLIAGYRDGWVSETIMRVTDVFLAVPQLVLALAMAQILSGGIWSAILALALTYWPFFTRTVYSETRRVRSALFIDALESLGASRLRILTLHVMPNVAAPVIVRATAGMGFTILTLAVLGFLGVGAAPPDPDWGLTIAESRQYLPQSWWYATFPGLAIFIVVLGFSFLGDGLRDLVDPRLRRSR
ncbi:ABC transporter permease [Aliihoeflea sp. 40Bstr573]|uniref:ABC transporter permease n=1 Tax=Aliihoeflea sp. 40Bstr573 TaxID=2696467 RepID=UPI002095E43B|nr:ABC transporter permease [Aliihoeflea sp. 40Bstr573]MCO6386966.1 ABC transporter permease subunit [Aliihoeflea sp. 40Bstr573]